MRKKEVLQLVSIGVLLFLAVTPSVAHAGALQLQNFEAAKANKLGKPLADLCKRVGCVGSKPITTDPIISTVGLPPLTQGQGVVISGKNFGDSPGTVILKGAFLVYGVSTMMSVDLPILPGYWKDTFIGTAPIPTNLVGLDQDVIIQVKSASNVLSREQKVAFVTQREIKLVPPSAIAGKRHMVPGVTNTIGIIVETEIHDDCGISGPSTDVWTTQLRDYQKFDSWVFGHWVGNFPQEPTFVVINNGITYSVTWYMEHTTDVCSWWGIQYNCDWVCDAGYWVNMYYSTPAGMD